MNPLTVSRVVPSKAVKGFFYTKFFKIMIYKFIEESGHVSLEFEQVGNDSIKVSLEEIHPEGNEIDKSISLPSGCISSKLTLIVSLPTCSNSRETCPLSSINL